MLSLVHFLSFYYKFFQQDMVKFMGEEPIVLPNLSEFKLLLTRLNILLMFLRFPPLSHVHSLFGVQLSVQCIEPTHLLTKWNLKPEYQNGDDSCKIRKTSLYIITYICYKTHMPSNHCVLNPITATR